MTQPPSEVLTGPATSILRRRWFWVAFVAVLAVLAAMAGGSALADRGELVNTARTVDAAPEALTVDGTVTSSRSTGNQGNQGNQGNGQGNPSNGQGNPGNGQGNQGNGQGNQGNGQGNQPAPVVPAPTLPGTGETPPVTTPPVTTPPVTTPPAEDEPGTPVVPVVTLPEVVPPIAPIPPISSETPAEEQPVDEPAVPVVVVPQPAVVPLVAIGIAPGCVDDKAVLVQKAENEDTKGVSVNFLANADFATSGSRSLTTGPDAKDRDKVTVTAASGKAYVSGGSIAVRTYRAGQTLAGVAYPAVSETRTLTYDAFTCEKPAVVTNVKAQLVNGRIVLAMYARNTGNTTLQVKFNPTAHFPGSASFELAPGAARYVTVPTASTAVPATAVSVNVVSSVQGKRVALNQIAKHDALSVAVPN